MSTTEGTSATAVGGSALSEGLGPLPPYLYGSECGPLERVWTERDMRDYAAQAVAAARERCAIAGGAAANAGMGGADVAAAIRGA